MATGSKLVIYAALVGNGLIAIAKFVGASITGSSAMISEGIHSLVDCGNQVLLLFGLKQAAKPPDEQFPFGHGKEIYFWSFVVAILIFSVGAGISIYKGIHHIMHPAPITNIMVNYIVLAAAIVFEGFAFAVAFKEFNKVRGKMSYFKAVQTGKDPTLFVVLFEDGAAMAGLIVAMVGIWIADTTGMYQFDGIASVVIGLILAGTAIWLAIETKSLLIGEAAQPEIVAGIREIINEFDMIDQVNEVRTVHMGPEYILATISADFKDETRAGDLERANAEMDRRIKAAFPKVKHTFIEAEANDITPEDALG